MNAIKNLKLIRLKKGKTQLQVSLDTGINQSMLSKYERGTVIPSDVLIILAKYYNTNIEYLLDLSDDDSPIL